ncbi:uncharacterized protein V6R79_017084 [Siganus canaliculatus]
MYYELTPLQIHACLWFDKRFQLHQKTRQEELSCSVPIAPPLHAHANHRNETDRTEFEMATLIKLDTQDRDVLRIKMKFQLLCYIMQDPEASETDKMDTLVQTLNEAITLMNDLVSERRVHKQTIQSLHEKRQQLLKEITRLQTLQTPPIPSVKRTMQPTKTAPLVLSSDEVGNMDEADEEDLLDLFSRMGSSCLPSELPACHFNNGT